MKTLAGQRVLITRSEEDCAAWARELEAAGATPITLPCIHSEQIITDELLATINAEIARTDWLVFTSRRGVAAFAALHEDPLPESVKVAAVGPATADVAVLAFGRADLVSEKGTAATLAQALAARLENSGGHVLLAVAENAGTTIEDALREAGASCVRVDVYRTVAAASAERKQALSALGADNVLLASPSAVAGFLNQVELDKPAAIYTIGPATNDAATAAGLTVTAQARRPGLEGLMEAMRCTS